ncbi:hypothetical protein [Salana multivorans]
MTDRIDHAARARLKIEAAQDQQARDGEFDWTVRDEALLAQAEATLALVEQLRLANLVAIAHGTDGALSTALRDLAYLTLGDDGINPDIAAALGLTVEEGDRG